MVVSFADVSYGVFGSFTIGNHEFGYLHSTLPGEAVRRTMVGHCGTWVT